ncbi:YhhN-like protein [Stigmatella aurantiaca]|uniref:YhhN-like protein n=1 Tax=Stigmatella aurantiaca TaxID=41 RepID=A0A1H8CJ70_STIAU|nr:lysoplasmalogenase [Stigmatella aurantiaca]SEM95050.1 YhhN-like protein [Stigmatella aurantiaca]
MSTAVSSTPLMKSRERLMYVLLIGASALNLSINLIADVMYPIEDVKQPPSLPAWMPLLIAISKPMIVPSLAGILYLSRQGTASTIRWGAFYVALFFCWIGDIALLFEESNYFFIGLGSFGVGHIFFIRSYLLLDRRAIQWKSFAYGLPFIVYGYTLYSIIYHQLMLPKEPHTENPTAQALAIAGYMVVLLSNGMTGSLRLRLKHKPSSSTSILAGIVLFVQSDSIIAVTEYVSVLPIERFAIMATYILGLCLMVHGCILDSQESEQQQPSSFAAA